MNASGRRLTEVRKDAAPSALRRFRAWPSARARRWVSALATKTCADPNTLALVAIGSLVRNVMKVQDADLLWIYESNRPEVLDHPLDVDVRAYHGDEVPDLIAAGHDLLGWALRYGHVICEHDQFWSRLEARWRSGTPLPDPRVAETRALRAEAVYHDLRQLGDLDAAQEQLVSLLTHRAWARLLREGVYPASRPELADQLRGIGDELLAQEIEIALSQRSTDDTPSSQRHTPPALTPPRR